MPFLEHLARKLIDAAHYTPAADLPTGVRGEREAERFLKKRGHKVVGRNWSCHAGEFDLITRDGPWLVFVEVKATEHGDLDRPEERVTPAKIKKLRQAASVYLIRFRGNMPAVRFDVVAVDFPGGEAKPIIRHVEHAFDVERSTATR